MKRKVSLFLAFFIMASTFISPVSVFADELKEIDYKFMDETKPARAGGVTVYKKNVSYSYEYGSYNRVSDNVYVGKGETGTISANRSVTFSTQVSGNISGLGISASTTVTSTLGYTLSSQNEGTWYLATKPYYKVERGTRVYVNNTTGAKTETNYTVKVPQYCTYALLKGY